MDKSKFAFSKQNYILLIIGIVAIVAGFILMGGPGSKETYFEPDIFSVRRIKVAPAICFLGFIFVIFAIMFKKSEKKEGENK